MAVRTADEWFALYGESHQHPTNKLIHFIFVPLIMFSVLGLFWSIPLPEAVASVSPWLNAASLFTLSALVFYTSTSRSLGLGMLLISALMLSAIAGLHQLLAQSTDHPRAYLAIGMFALFLVSWILQFIGHNIEGKKPSFLRDLQFLLVGPMWILGFVYRKLGISY